MNPRHSHSPAARLKTLALRYLARFDASAEQLRRHLQRRRDFTPADDIALGQLIPELEQLGYLNDGALAVRRVEALRSRGSSARGIRERLGQLGISPAHIDAALNACTIDERQAAARLLRRRSRTGSEASPAERQRRFRVLLRHGFGSDVAAQLLADVSHEQDLTL